MKCEGCRNALIDYEEYYGGARRYFICGCDKDVEPDGDDCEEYSEYIEPDPAEALRFVEK